MNGPWLVELTMNGYRRTIFVLYTMKNYDALSMAYPTPDVDISKI